MSPDFFFLNDNCFFKHNGMVPENNREFKKNYLTVINFLLTQIIVAIVSELKNMAV